VLHVQLVSKVARTIGRVLNLNEDLIESISLGHDVGHTPFGHTGERFVSQFCQEHGAGCFAHNAQSFRQFHEIENKSLGVNLTAQTLDGILCHNGEMISTEYKNNSAKTPEMLLNEYRACMEKQSASRNLVPMTMEGCVMRISDIIAYVGRDIEDAIIVNLIKRYDIPKQISDVLGNDNKHIVNSVILDIVNNSYGKNAISFSPDVFMALNNLKDWNYKHIYNNVKKNAQDEKIKSMFFTVMETLLNGRATNLVKSNYDAWLNSERSVEYVTGTEEARKVADYVSGMTDDFLLKVHSDLVVPTSFGLSF
jgi:dGTPase